MLCNLTPEMHEHDSSWVQTSSTLHSVWPSIADPAIITANHCGWLDGPVLALITPRSILFGVDPWFLWHWSCGPMLRGWARVTGCSMVPMAKGSLWGLRAMLKHLEAGGWVCLFPEGGIGTGVVHPGAAWLQVRSQVPIHRLHLDAVGPGKLKVPYRIAAGRSPAGQ